MSDPKPTDRESFVAYLRGKAMACPSCGYDDWNEVRDVTYLMVTAGDDGSESPAPEDQGLGVLPILALDCRNCGYLRLHLDPYA
jgi:hypothetical protein